MRPIERDARAYQGPVALRIAIQSRTIGRMNIARRQALGGKLLQHGPKPGELALHTRNVRRIRAGQMRHEPFEVQVRAGAELLEQRRHTLGRHAKAPHTGIDLHMDRVEQTTPARGALESGSIPT